MSWPRKKAQTQLLQASAVLGEFANPKTCGMQRKPKALGCRALLPADQLFRVQFKNRL